jgi:hypothetical protein
MVAALKDDPAGFYRGNRLEGAPPDQAAERRRVA